MMYELNGYLFVKSGRGCFRTDHVLSFLDENNKPSADAFVSAYIDNHGFVKSATLSVREDYLRDIWEQADRAANGIKVRGSQIDTGVEIEPAKNSETNDTKPKVKATNRKSEAKKE